MGASATPSRPPLAPEAPAACSPLRSQRLLHMQLAMPAPHLHCPSQDPQAEAALQGHIQDPHA